jgi:hypothetical protein
MTDITTFDDFDQVLSNFNRREERLFLGDIREFAKKQPEVVIKTFALLLKNQELNIQLKFLILKSIGELKYEEFVPVVKEALKQENKVQLVSAAVNSLTAIHSLPAYKVAADFLLNHQDTEFAEKVEQSLKALFNQNQLAYHFDVFYRSRGSVRNLEKSSQFLSQHLPDDYVKDLLSAATSRFPGIRSGALRILKNRPNPIYYPTLYCFFKENMQTAEDDLFLLMSETLVINASLSNARMKIFQELKAHLDQLTGDKRDVFCIALLTLNTREMMPHIMEIYPGLNFDRKMLLMENLKPKDYKGYMKFARELLDNENNQTILAKVVKLLIQANDFNYLFNALDREKGVRKQKLLEMLLGHDPPGIAPYLQKYITPSQVNQILLPSLTYLLKHAADKYFELIKIIFFSGVSPEIKIQILRNTDKFQPHHQKLFLEAIFQDLAVIRDFRKDFLFSLLGTLNRKVLDQEAEEKILSRILVLMEETPKTEIVNFIYFFDRYEIDRLQDSILIISELQLIRNTLLKSGNEQDLVRMIHELIKNIEHKMTLKKKPIPG